MGFLLYNFNIRNNLKKLLISCLQSLSSKTEKNPSLKCTEDTGMLTLKKNAQNN